ncbi:type 1 glutamine amidotransferase [Spongiactinospora sp. TRM90649]|uniref:type 1 glutamine amidotransferase n=1 Tax=Spongiactinospora sp. TRM90649 TaxID=3031114 RepID=UPI0023F866F5|nr:type 1 glutamine amidotransferase [Spongiactinospora sp. TRM90649]MDF5755642.1 type 1 glutamine amidotransferase [Spongiactinospora sp. TRM90649]
MAITVIEHGADAPIGAFGDWLSGEGAEIAVVRPYLGQPVPDAAPGGLIVLGGEGSAWDDEAQPWLPATRDLIARCVADGVPTLGICLGAQLMALACGGAVEHGAAGLEIGLGAIVSLPAAATDPLFGLTAETCAVTYHHDAVTVLPPGAVPLLTGDVYPNQGYRLGETAWAVQFHPEATYEIFASWTAATAGPLGAMGLSVTDLNAQVERARDRLAATWGPVARTFAGFCRSETPAVRDSRS